MAEISRRTFFAAGAGMAAVSVSAGAAARKIRHAVLGTGGQGTAHAKVFQAHPDCELAAICDLDPARRARAVEVLGNPSGLRVEDEYERVLDDETIDSVSIASPDHWHTKLALHALDAGKHVYVEKPCSHTIEEAYLLMEAAERTGLCVQHGTQARSSAGIRAAVEQLRGGRIGQVRMAKAINHQLRGPIGRAEPAEPPEGVNYDRWLGPAPVHAFTRNRWHYNWHWFWDYGCGDIGNDGIHQIDQARWGLGVGLPNVISGSGGQLFYDDDHETPDTQTITYEYDDCHLLYEMRLWTPYKLEGHDNGVVFYGDKGTMETGRHGCHVTMAGGEREKIGDGASLPDNIANFVEAVQREDPAHLMAPVSEGGPSSMLCHMGNIATRIGERLEFDADARRFTSDAANALLGREYRAGYGLPGVG